MTTTNSTTTPPKRKWKVNAHVRTVMALLESRYGNDKSSDWSRTRAYVYRAGEDRLDLQQVQQVMNLLDSYTSSKVARNILQTTPRILGKPVKSFLEPTADFLYNLWGHDLFQEAMKRNPRLLLSSGVGYVDNNSRRSTSSSSQAAYDDDDENVESLLSDLAGLSSSTGIPKLKRSAPFVFGLPPSKVRSILEFLSGILADHPSSTIKVSSVIGRIVVAHPHLLNLSVDTNLTPRMEFLSHRCGLNSTDVAKLVQSSSGSVLGLSVEANLKPTLDFLSQLLEHDNTQLRKSILAHPQLLGLSLLNLQSKAAYFESIGGRSLSSRIAFRCPAVYSLSLVDNVTPTIEFLTKVWGVSSEDITNSNNDDSQTTSDNGQLSQFLLEYPTILTLSLEGNIQPTMDFFNRTGYTELTDDWELVEGKTRIRGRYIAASLFNRLLPRWHFSFSTGREDSLPLHIIVSASDKAFCNELGTESRDFVDFKREAIPRLKFSSQFDTWLKTGRRIEI